jgi:hypothetical protein
VCYCLELAQKSVPPELTNIHEDVVGRVQLALDDFSSRTLTQNWFAFAPFVRTSKRYGPVPKGSCGMKVA